jgi:hypothetical protein
MEAFNIYPLDKKDYPDVKRVLEGLGYRLYGDEWMGGEDCVSALDDGEYMTYNYNGLDKEDEPVYTFEEFMAKYGSPAPKPQGLASVGGGISTEAINSPSHYTAQSKEVWEMMIDLYGKEKFMAFCELNAFKYRMRAGYKGSPLQDIQKAKWYEAKMKELGTA